MLGKISCAEGWSVLRVVKRIKDSTSIGNSRVSEMALYGYMTIVSPQSLNNTKVTMVGNAPLLSIPSY
jgi:hypothetical protein